MFSEIKLTKEQAKAKCDVCWGDCRRCALDILRKQEEKTGESTARPAGDAAKPDMQVTLTAARNGKSKLTIDYYQLPQGTTKLYRAAPSARTLTLADLEKALDADYPLPNSPHASVNYYAQIKRDAFTRGWHAALAATGTPAEAPKGGAA